MLSSADFTVLRSSLPYIPGATGIALVGVDRVFPVSGVAKDRNTFSDQCVLDQILDLLPH